ncbi:hypothetical protein ACSS6W_002493 [Trichoderma asperelloides]
MTLSTEEEACTHLNVPIFCIILHQSNQNNCAVKQKKQPLAGDNSSWLFTPSHLISLLSSSHVHRAPNLTDEFQIHSHFSHQTASLWQEAGTSVEIATSAQETTTTAS